MATVINNKYKETVSRYADSDLSPITRAVCVLEELDMAKSDDGEPEYDYYTLVKAVIESYLGEEVEVI